MQELYFPPGFTGVNLKPLPPEYFAEETEYTAAVWLKAPAPIRPTDEALRIRAFCESLPLRLTFQAFADAETPSLLLLRFGGSMPFEPGEIAEKLLQDFPQYRLGVSPCLKNPFSGLCEMAALALLHHLDSGKALCRYDGGCNEFSFSEADMQNDIGFLSHAPSAPEAVRYFYTAFRQKSLSYAEAVTRLNMLISALAYRKPAAMHRLRSMLQSPLYNLRFNSVFEMTEAYFQYIRETAEDEAESRDGQLIDKITGYIDRYYYKDLSLNDIAEQFNIHPNYLCRIFSQKKGVHLKKYLTERKLKQACSLLSCTDLPVFEIAAAAGFSNAAYFNDVFRKIIRQTPTEYRRKSKEISK